MQNKTIIRDAHFEKVLSEVCCAATILVEAAANIGRDQAIARRAHGALCLSSDAGAAFAAVSVEKAIEHYAEADRIMKLMGSLAEEV